MVVKVEGRRATDGLLESIGEGSMFGFCGNIYFV